jgi:acyl transferase domain-containing protein/NADPH:quinone reductase-like Zn-dependent oxidoreductase
MIIYANTSRSYVKAEAINALYLKRLDDAIRDGDPIRAVIRGTASNASGRTQGIANPSSAAQAMVTKRAYENAGITDFRETFFVECHGTGTLAGDPVEVSGVASVFGPGRLPGQELIIGSIKSNVGHAEAAAGINGLIKATFAVERGMIPGNPTFITPSPRIDWARLNVKASRANVPWTAPFRRASVNSFGFGGANAHVVIENAPQSSHVSSYKAISSNFFDDDDEDEGIDTSGDATEPKLLVFSANEPSSLQNYTQALNRHLLNPSVSINVDDLAYTLSERRSKLYHRGFSLSRTRVTSITNMITDKQMSSTPRVGFVFTGQGAQWAKMGAELLRSFPIARRTIDDLDKVLQSLANPPKWLLSEELTLERSSEALRQPEFSQPLVTALQLALLDVLADWNLRPCAVVGHSSGEIAAAAAAGYMTYADAIKTAFYRGQAAKTLGAPPKPVGMLAIGVGPSEVEKYLVPEDNVQIACYNSPSSLTLSGTVEALERTRDRLQADKHFARLLLVDLAYHSDYMSEIGKVYEQVLLDDGLCQPRTRDQSLQHPVMFSSVQGRAFKSDEFPDAAYWKKNMVSPVKFTHAASALLRDTEAGANVLIEVGPSNALAGPLAQIKKDLASKGAVDFIYNSALTRGQDSTIALYKTAGHLFLAGAPIDLTRVNRIDKQHAKVIVDLPNYSWNHTNRYWHETRASKDWRFKRFVNHDLLGSKIGGTSWDAPMFKKVLKVADVPWLRDHCLGTDIVFPGAAYVAMAVEAVHQTALSAHWNFQAPPKYRFRLRDVQITRALVLDEKKETRLTLSLGAAKKQSNRVWFTWTVRSVQDGTTDEVHATGLVGFETDYQDKIAAPAAVRPLENPASSQIWYKSLANMGYNFGPSFQHHVAVEGNIGQRNTRSSIKLEPPPSNPLGQSRYPIHPAVIDACFQATSPALWKCELPPSGSKVLVPKIIGDIIVEAGETDLPEEGIALASATYLGIGNPGQSRNYQTHVSLYNPKSGKLLVEVRGLVPGEIEVEDSKPDLPLITRLVWKPDIGLALKSLKGPAATTWASKQSVQNVLDLIAHKEPRLALLEVNLTSSFQSAWSLEGPSSAIRAAASKFEVAVVDPKVMLAAQEKLPGVEVQLVNASTLDLGRPSASYDLLVLLSGSEVEASSHQQIEDLFDLVKPGGFIVSQGLDPVLIESYGKSLYTEDHYAFTQRPIEGKGSGSRLSIQHLSLLSDKAQCHPEVHQTITALSKEGWNVKTVADLTTLDATSEDLFLVLDELHSNILDTVDSKQWDVIQSLVNSRAKLLWVTAGGQNIVHSPNRAAIAGLFRSIRNEEQVRFSTLDVRSSIDEHTIAAISACLDQLASDDHSSVLPDSDFVQQGAEVLISRIVPDDHLSVLQDDKPDQQPVETVDLQGFEGIVQMGCERLGSLDSIQFSEVTSAKALDQGTVEVKIHAAGLNYKDVVVTMGHVPGDETQLGYEAAGIITQVASDVEGLVPGDRVVVWGKGCFANRIRTTPSRVHKIPDHLTFQDAATMPIVYVTSIHSLFDQAALSSGKTVLIHSAAGGIGIASIQLAKYCGAEIFVTVGSQEKRDYLRTTFGLGDDHIFSSRNADFSEQILNYTGGRGVDVVLNSLTGEMLEESFRVLADGGIMVEIGKKDIIDRATLTMTPFDRNISFRAVDLSAERAPDALVARNLKRLFELFEQGHIAPIKPIKQFSWSDVPSAIRYMRNGQHMGKIILYDGENPAVQVPVRFPIGFLKPHWTLFLTILYRFDVLYQSSLSDPIDRSSLSVVSVACVARSRYTLLRRARSTLPSSPAVATMTQSRNASLHRSTRWALPSIYCRPT